MENESSVDKFQIMPPEALMSRFGKATLVLGIIFALITTFVSMMAIVDVASRLDQTVMPLNPLLSWISFAITVSIAGIYILITISLLRCSDASKKSCADSELRFQHILDQLNRYYFYVLLACGLTASNIILTILIML